MHRRLKYVVSVVVLLFLTPVILYAQFDQEMLGNRYIRVADMGESADTLNVWGDVGSSGRYIVPKETTLPELISYSLGYAQVRGRSSRNKWAKTQIEVKVSRYKENLNEVDVSLFKYKFSEPEPVDMFQFDLQNNDIVSLEVRRKPTFRDYVGVIAPVVSVVATSVLLIENLR